MRYFTRSGFFSRWCEAAEPTWAGQIEELAEPFLILLESGYEIGPASLVSLD